MFAVMRGFVLTALAFVTAQAELAGASGWAGAGLLGLVLAVHFFVILPAKDKQLKELVAGHAGQVKELIESKDQIVRELITASTSWMAEVARQMAEQYREERGARQAQHADNRADLASLRKGQLDQRDYFVARVEKAEQVFANSLQSTRHRIVNVENGLSGMAEVLKQVLDWLRRQQAGEPERQRRRGNPHEGE